MMICPKCGEWADPVGVGDFHDDGSHDEQCDVCGAVSNYHDWVRASEDMHTHELDNDDGYEDEDEE
mgnify:CR=1 FL=1